MPWSLRESIPELKLYGRNFLEWNYNTWTDLVFKLIFKFIIILTKKSCYKSAIEYNKLLLKLNPVQDPLGAIVMMDHLCLASKRYEYLEDFTLTFGHRYYNSYECSLVLYPNFLFSYALSKFKMMDDKLNLQNYLWKKIDKQDLQDILEMNIDFRRSSADKILLLALILYPSLFKQILTANEQYKQDPTESGFTPTQRKKWKDLFENEAIFMNFDMGSVKYSFLNIDSSSDTDALLKIEKIYPERNKLLWKHSNVNVWMKRVCGFLVDAVDNKQVDLDEFRGNLEDTEDIDLRNNLRLYFLPFEPKIHKSLLTGDFTDEQARIDFDEINEQEREQMQNMNNVIY